MLKQSIASMTRRRDLLQAKFGFLLFLATLAIFFAASLVAYFVILGQASTSGGGEFAASDEPVRSIEPMKIPLTFWISAVVMVAVSVLLHLACRSVHRERLQPFLRYLFAAFVSSIVFTVIQFIGMYELLVVHLNAADGSTKFYGLSFTLSVLHAVHVFGGLAFLWVVSRTAFEASTITSNM